jgi:5'-nucleotidase
MRPTPFLLAPPLVILLGSCSSSPSPSSTTQQSVAQGGSTITLLHTNDTHSWDEAVPVAGPEPEQGGAARRKTLIDRVRAERGVDHVLLLDAGDFSQGTIFYKAWGGSSDVAVMNALGYDVTTLGNHEFDKGPGHLADVLNGAPVTIAGQSNDTEPMLAPVVATNLDTSNEPLLDGLVAPSVVIERGGDLYGIVGTITETTPQISSPGPTLAFTDYVASVQAEVDQLTGLGITRIILLSHSGSQVDIANAARLSGVDVIIAGHDHVLFGDAHEVTGLGLPNTAKNIPDPYPTKVIDKSGRPVLVVSAESYGRWLGRLDVTFDADGVVQDWVGDPMLVRGCEAPSADAGAAPGGDGGAPRDCSRAVDEDPDVKDLVSRYGVPVDSLRKQVIGQAAVDLTRYTPGSTVPEESLMGDLVADEMLEAGQSQGAVAALTNSGGLRADIGHGDVHWADAYSVLPFDNVIWVVELTGQELVAALENGLSRVGGKDFGAFPQVAGMQITWHQPSVTPGTAPPTTGYLVSVSIGGRAVDPSDVTSKYKIATNDYMMGGGDFYKVLATACARSDASCKSTGTLMLDALIADFQGHSPVSRSVDGRIRLVP